MMTCAKSARDRLLELQIDDDTLYSVKISRMERVWASNGAGSSRFFGGIRRMRSTRRMPTRATDAT